MRCLNNEEQELVQNADTDRPPASPCSASVLLVWFPHRGQDQPAGCWPFFWGGGAVSGCLCPALAPRNAPSCPRRANPEAGARPGQPAGGEEPAAEPVPHHPAEAGDHQRAVPAQGERAAAVSAGRPPPDGPGAVTALGGLEGGEVFVGGEVRADGGLGVRDSQEADAGGV